MTWSDLNLNQSPGGSDPRGLTAGAPEPAGGDVREYWSPSMRQLPRALGSTGVRVVALDPADYAKKCPPRKEAKILIRLNRKDLFRVC